MDFVIKFPENRVLYRKIDIFGKLDKMGYTSVKSIIFHFCEKKLQKWGSPIFEVFFRKNGKISILH